MPPTECTTDHGHRPAPLPRLALFTRRRYLVLLGWAFTFFSSVRVLSYVPTLWVIVRQQDSSQHSLLTWGTWLGANLTMAAWLYEHNGHRFNPAVGVNLANATMCGLTTLLIGWYRVMP